METQGQGNGGSWGLVEKRSAGSQQKRLQASSTHHMVIKINQLMGRLSHTFVRTELLFPPIQ